MKALIKRASLCVLLMVSATSALADLIDARRALLDRQFSKALEFAHSALCPPLNNFSDVGVQIRSTSACPAEEYVR